MFLTALALPLFSQNKLADKANEFYKYNQFADAAALYEQALTELSTDNKAKRSVTAIKTKLAYCYRMNNKMDKAEALYAEIVKEDKASDETLFYYGEALMSNGKYEEAKKWFVAYLRLKPEDEQGRLMAAACDKVQLIQPYFPFVEIEAFPFNSPADDNAPVAWQGGIVFSSDRQQGIKLMKEKSGWTGRDYLDLYFSEKTADSAFAEPKKFSGKLSEVNKNTGNASFPADGSEVFFTRNTNELNKQNTYNLQLYRAESAGEGRWKSVEPLPFCSPAYNFMHPAISPGGQWLFFVTNKGGGEGGTDIWVSKRKSDGWERPENLGAKINTPANEGFPFVDAEGRLYFCSKGHPGFGGFDIFFTEKDEKGEWKTPVNLGKPINSSLDDISIYIAPDKRSGMFTSSRDGGDDDIYLFRVLDEAPAVSGSVPEQSLPSLPAQTASEETGPELPASENKAGENPEVIEVQPAADTLQEIVPATAPATPEVKTQKPALPPPPAPAKPAAKEIEQPKESPPPAKGAGQPATLDLPFTASTGTGKQPFIFEAKPPAPDAETPDDLAPVTLPAFVNLEIKLELGQLSVGDIFRLDGAIYDANIWQLTPRISSKLDRLVALMQKYPSLEIEIGAYTEAIGVDQENMVLSQNRAEKAMEYMVREGIPASRLAANGYGETTPLNHCRNGVNCTQEEHLYNQRLEVKILKK